MANQLTFSIDGQVTDTVLNQILDTISRYQITLDQPGDNIFRSNLVADNAAGANVAFPATLPLPALVLVVNRDATNDLLIGPAVAGPAIARFVQIPPSLFSLFILDSTATLRYMSLVAPVPFSIRAWSI